MFICLGFCASPQVTLFHVESEAGSSHAFTIDQAVRSVRLQIAGKLTQCVLINPTGMFTHTNIHRLLSCTGKTNEKITKLYACKDNYTVSK